MHFLTTYPEAERGAQERMGILRNAEQLQAFQELFFYMGKSFRILGFSFTRIASTPYCAFLKLNIRISRWVLDCCRQ